MVSCPGHEVTGIPSGPGIVVIEMMRDVCKIISVHRALAGLMGITIRKRGQIAHLHFQNISDEYKVLCAYFGNLNFYPNPITHPSHREFGKGSRLSHR